MAAAGAPWQLECENVEERCGYLLTSGIWSDCIFMVGSETNQEVIHAHKLVLAMASPVFEAMLYGGLSERNEPIVPIPDLQPEAFRALLQYIYTGNINFDSFDMACDLWYGANKYMLPHLKRQCNRYIWSVVGPRNACQAYEIARLFDDMPLMDKCIQIISSNTKEVLNDSSFEDVELNTVITVCSLDNLTVDSELDLFHAVERYAEADQRRQGQINPRKEFLLSAERSPQTSPAAELGSQTPTEATPSKPTANKHHLKKEQPSIRTALQKIRFLSLSAQVFAEGPARSGLLTKDETLAILMNIASVASPVPMPIGFSDRRERRQPRDPQEQCFEPGSLDHTINALKCGSPSRVQEAAQVAWDILDTPDFIQPALDKGILDALVPALTTKDDECKYKATCAICTLCERGSPAQLDVLAASAALEPYCRLLAARWCNTYFNVLDGLTYLLKNVEQSTRADLLLRLQALGIPLLLRPLKQLPRAYERELVNDLLQTYFRDRR